jgi:hypothetical protein
MLEKGLNRKEGWQIEADNFNQSRARIDLMQLLRLDIETQEPMSIWDWEFFRGNKLVAIGEYRRRFNDFGTFPDFQFSEKKFKTMMAEGAKRGVPALMFVEFDDLYLYFPLEGSPEVKIMRRNHEVRTENCVVIPNKDFRYVYHLDL